MVPSLTAVDRRGRPVAPGLLYGDARGGSEGGEAAGFLRWLADEVPDAAGYWPAPAVANRSLGGPGAIDIGTAFASGPLFAGGPAAADLCAGLGVEVARLPGVEMMGAPIGRVTGTDAVLAGGGVDSMCEQLVAGADDVGDVLVIFGTTLLIWAVVGTDRQVPGLWTTPHPQPDRWALGGASNAGGLFVGWATALAGRVDEAAALDPANVPVWVPYVRGERTPLHDPTRRASLVDLDLTHGPAAVRRAAWEASGFVVRHHLELAGVRPRRLVTAGGGTRVDGWMQALADCTGEPVHVAAEPEGAAIGAAYLARMAIGGVSGFEEATSWARTGRVVEPDPAWARAADERYQRFREVAGRDGA
jgi:xylulokinase